MVIASDPGGHALFIGMPTGSFIITARELADPPPFSNQDDMYELSASNVFGTLQGPLKTDGSFTLTGSGPAAGFQNVGRRFTGTIDFTGKVVGVSRLPSMESSRAGRPLPITLMDRFPFQSARR
jgi:hypothetical protein